MNGDVTFDVRCFHGPQNGFPPFFSERKLRITAKRSHLRTKHVQSAKNKVAVAAHRDNAEKKAAASARSIFKKLATTPHRHGNVFTMRARALKLGSGKCMEPPFVTIKVSPRRIDRARRPNTADAPGCSRAL
jgi:hypothetical protein